ncbi:hypothetical protein KK083_23505 [Fulvivirgaceae bacterium PWU4]|uniref:Uncharacterized protein n=1 Tax=Chryseosolibacter histidini TaxID=2782349 RepID=A0AAP2DQU9_9BACT|nr:hypothetical protein [Chryseosolibacter histidini]MBT1699874.1 hypothetical protein [Chryseosolibacter histidini]
MKLIVNKTHSTMKNEGKILELLADMALKQDHMVEELRTVKEDLSNVKSEISKLNAGMTRVNSEIVKLNLQTSENTRAIFKLSDKVELLVDHEKRISKLENIVLK